MKHPVHFSLLLTLAVLVGACAPQTPAPPTSTPMPTASATPDPCDARNLPATVSLVNDHMRKFDEYATVASGAAQSQLGQVIPSMQTVRQEAGNQSVPACLAELKRLEILYMDTAIQTLLAFQSNPKANELAASILQARQYHSEYSREMARLLGVTLVAPSPTASAAASVTPAAALASTAGATPSVAATIVNPGPNPLNLHVSASLTSQSVATLAANQSAAAVGKSQTGEWILIEVPDQSGQKAWVYASLVQFSSGDISALPIVSP